MKLKITIGKNIATAILFDNATSKDFVSLLPLTLELNDYANTEKVANLDKRLSIENSPDGFDPSIGDLTYYAPWGNIALFYKDLGYAKGLVSLGKITNGMEYLSVKGSLNIVIELD
ncbi:cyclophilin-like fold protein [Flavobacteriaceae bacterium SZ-1-7]|uniref:cyclophilin-like fold protein n=1 Tax=Tamlana sedimenti TaxID=3134126 RepID=UPI003120F149